MIAVAITVGALVLVCLAIFGLYHLAKKNAEEHGDKGALPQLKKWNPEWVPITVLISTDFGDWYETISAAAQDGVEFWNGQLGRKVFNDVGGITREGGYVAFVPYPDPELGRIFEGDEDFAMRTYLLFDDEGQIDSCRIYLKWETFHKPLEILFRDVKHEKGHSLGLDHDDFPESIMYGREIALRPQVTKKDKQLLLSQYFPEE